jgi:putative transposase
MHKRLLDQFKMRAALSGKGNCFDNAPVERFWGTLKTELVFQRKYATRQEATQDITEYMALFYNRQRRQEKIGDLSPAIFERRFYEPEQFSAQPGAHH